MKLNGLLFLLAAITVAGCGGDDGGSAGPDGGGGIPGGSKNIACTMNTGAGSFCIGVEKITQTAYDSENSQCMQQHGTVTDKCASANLAGCCENDTGVISLQCDYSDLPAVTIQHDMAGCTSPKHWVTAVP